MAYNSSVSTTAPFESIIDPQLCHHVTDSVLPPPAPTPAPASPASGAVPTTKKRRHVVSEADRRDVL
jgi:hypothetical protein